MHMAKAKAGNGGGTAVATKPKTGTALVNMQDAIKNEIANIASRTGNPGGDVIRLSGKKFTLPDGSVHPGPLKVVIVDFVTTRHFYDRPFDQKNPCPPACYAISVTPTGMVPPKDVPVRQNDECSKCPNNEFGSAGDGKACKESRFLAVIPEDADANTELAVISVSPTGIKRLDSYVRSLAGSLQKAPFQVITEISFDTSVDFPSLMFGNPQPAEPDLVATAFNMREAARARLTAPIDTSQYTPPTKKGGVAKSARR
jgi:hypothetical protein